MKGFTLSLGMIIAVAELKFAAANGAIVLENRNLRLELDTTAAPFVARLVHRASGRAVVDRPSSKNLFAIVLAGENGKTQTIESASASDSSAALQKTDGSTRVTLRYAGFPGADLSIEVQAACDERDPLTHWSLRTANNTGRTMTAVRFPILEAVPAIGDGKDDFLVLPALPGALIENPAENWRIGQSVTSPTPGTCRLSS